MSKIFKAKPVAFMRTNFSRRTEIRDYMGIQKSPESFANIVTKTAPCRVNSPMASSKKRKITKTALVTSARAKGIISEPTWQKVTKSTTGRYMHSKHRIATFAKWPDATLVRPPPVKGTTNKAFRLLCKEEGCLATLCIGRAIKSGTRKCREHSTVNIFGFAVFAPHIIAMKDKITKIVKRKNSVNAKIYYIKCANGCSTLVDVTRPKDCKRTLCRWCLNPPGSRSHGYDRKKGSHPEIVAHWLKTRNGKPLHIPLRRCAGLGCEELIRFHAATSKAKAHRRLCLWCTAKTRRKQAYEGRYNTFVRSNKSSRGMSVDFDLKFYKKLVGDACCHYCRIKLPIAPYSHVESEVKGTGCMVDRKDNRLGYTKSNVVPCCPACNIMKGRMVTYEQMLCFGAVMTGDADRVLQLMKQHRRALAEHKRALDTTKNVRSINRSSAKKPVI